MFHVNDKVVYPGHGVARIIQIVEKLVAGKITTFFELQFLNKDMTVLVPTTNFDDIGIRPLSSTDKINDIFKLLGQPAKKIANYELTASNWNKRNKEYQNKLRSGNLHDISEIYRDLKYISQQKELSFGEKNLLNQTETLLAEEISIVQKVDSDQAVEHLRSMFNFVERQDSNRGHSQKSA